MRKLSGTTRPSRANQEAFDRAVEEVTEVATRLLVSLNTATTAPPRNRDVERMKAQQRSLRRFSTVS